MAVIETWLEQDLQAPVKVRYLDGSLFSNNGNGNRIGVRVYNNGEPVTLSGTVSGYVVVADGSTVPCTGTRSGNQASILIPPAAYQPGAVFISVFLTDGSTVTTLAAVSTTVMQTRTNSQVSPGSVVTDWTQTINAAMQSVVDANAANMAQTYGELTFPVPMGKYTLYNDLLYRAVTPIATSESWTAAHWTRVKLADDVSDLKQAMFQITGNEIYTNEYVNKYQRDHTNILNRTWNDTGVSVLVSCHPGEVFYVWGKGTNAYRLYTFADANGTELESAYSGRSVTTPLRIVAPANAAYLAANAKTDDANYSSWGLFKGDGLLIDTVNNLIDEGISNKCMARMLADVPAGVKHSSNDDRMSIRYKAGEPFVVYVWKGSANNAYFTVTAFYTDGTSEQLGSGTMKKTEKFFLELTGNKDIEQIGIYANTLSSNDEVQLCAITLSKQIYDFTNSNILEKIEMRDRYISHSHFTVQSGTTHSSLLDVANIYIPEGEKYTVRIRMEGGFRKYLQINEIHASTENVTTGFTYSHETLMEFEAQSDTVGIGVYVGTDSNDLTFEILVCRSGKENSLLYFTREKEVNRLSDQLDSQIGLFLENYNGSVEVDSYMFFTDPHNLKFYSEAGEDQLELLMDGFTTLENYANIVNPSTILCGGDWLNNGDTKAAACKKLSMIAGFGKKYLGDYNYHTLCGNHDTNYQGKENAQSENYTGQLTQDTINNLLFKNENTGKSYFSYKTNKTNYFCLDSGLDTNPNEMTAYRTEQLKWLSTQLENENGNIVIAIHLIAGHSTIENYPNGLTAMATKLIELIDAYNARGQFTIDNTTYNYANATGVIRCVLTGHTHFDAVYVTESGVPFVCTTDATDLGQSPMMFDLGFLDYTNNVLKIVRINETEKDRTVSLKTI